jgi:anti-anti-sigma factor
VYNTPTSVPAMSPTPHESPIDPATVVISVGPALDFRSAPDFRRTCEDQIAHGRRFFVLDLSQTGILDSTGLGAILAIHHKLLRASGRLLFAAPSRSAEVVIDLTRTSKVFGKYPTVDAALTALAGAE